MVSGYICGLYDVAIHHWNKFSPLLGDLNFVIRVDQFAPGNHTVTITATSDRGLTDSQIIPFRRIRLKM